MASTVPNEKADLWILPALGRECRGYQDPVTFGKAVQRKAKLLVIAEGQVFAAMEAFHEVTELFNLVAGERCFRLRPERIGLHLEQGVAIVARVKVSDVLPVRRAQRDPKVSVSTQIEQRRA